MKRRDLLQSMGMMPLLTGGVAGLGVPSWAAAASALKPQRRVRPSDPLWPATDKWDALKAQVGGRLIEPRSLFVACEGQPAATQCLAAKQYLGNPYWIGDQPGGTQVSGWVGAWTPAPSAYGIAARTPADVVAGVNFAREHNLRLVVKGAGHSYLGTSNAPDSLLIWTRAMNQITVHEAFVPEGCEGRVAPTHAVSTGAGAVWIDLYDAVTTQGGRYVQGGGCADVGVAGLVQSGGFGSFSRGFGTAAAGLLEAQIVTADGRVRTVNACTDPDLFWALKGGGGGTFGVVTRLTLQTHDAPGVMGAAFGKIKAQSDAAYKQLIARFLTLFRDHLLNAHWGEEVSVWPDNTLDISMVSQGLSKEDMAALWEPFMQWVRASPALYPDATLGFLSAQPRQWWTVEGNPYMVPDPRAGAPKDHGWWKGDQDQVGALLYGYESLWLPESLLTAQSQASLVEALFAASRHKRVQLHFNKGLAGAPPAALAAVRQTATNPKVNEAFALAIIADGGAPAYPGLPGASQNLAALKDAHAIDQAAAALHKVAPHSGSYVSESNFFNRSWQQEYWGPNYPRLKAIKTKYDPDGLFFVHHGVGSEAWSQDGFTRLA